MDAATLRSVMLDRISLDFAAAMLPHYSAALIAAGCTTVNRSAMMGAQLGHESASLRYMQEIASGAAYEGRRDLGNTEPGDGRRFKGRGPIQLTGRNNYGAFSRWCHGRGLVSTPDHFVRNPLEVATPRWGFLAAAWYWVVARPRINGLCDRGDLDGVTRQINGGLNGLADRRMRWDHCRALGQRLLPASVGPAAPAGPDPAIARRHRQQALHQEAPVEREFDGPFSGTRRGRIICPVGSASALVDKAWFSASFDGGARVQAWFQDARAGFDGDAPGTRDPIDWTLRNAERPVTEIPSGTEFIQYAITNAEGPGVIRIEERAR